MGDNAGPPPGKAQMPLDLSQATAVVAAHWKAYRAMFPRATSIRGAPFEPFWQALNASAARESLPVLSGEIGDTWICKLACFCAATIFA